MRQVSFYKTDKRTSDTFFSHIQYIISRNMIWYILSVILVTLSECNGYETGVKGTLEKITSNEFVTINEFPSSVSIQTVQFYHKCTGVILNRYYILTAAHCLWYPSSKETDKFSYIKTYYVVTGTHNISSSWVYGNYHRIDKVIMHSRFFSEDDLDMAVIKVVGYINLNGSTRKAAEFASVSQLFNNIEYNVTGWGLYDPLHKNTEASSVLRLATFQSKMSVLTGWKFIGFSSYDDINACKGDSGSGAFLNNKLIGIVSEGTCEYSNIKPHAVFINVLMPTSQSFIINILENKCPEKSVVIINKNLDWDPVFKKTDPPGTVTTDTAPITGLENCKIM